MRGCVNDCEAPFGVRCSICNSDRRAGWDTKVRCTCSAEFTSRCEFWRHQALAYEALVSPSGHLEDNRA